MINTQFRIMFTFVGEEEDVRRGDPEGFNIIGNALFLTLSQI